MSSVVEVVLGITELEELDQFRHGYKGACYACEPVGILNQELRARVAAAEAENQRLVKRVAELENLVVALAEKEDAAP